MSPKQHALANFQRMSHPEDLRKKAIKAMNSLQHDRNALKHGMIASRSTLQILDLPTRRAQNMNNALRRHFLAWSTLSHVLRPRDGRTST
jgi:hypothetical protein